ncbi:T9SS type A sorting domain-containing protein [Aestuariibaculum sediminum]|uniref:Proprotein convertase P-domain-containing protein n=1 Tax=Aestuariibaculum sediminum TaxID=2770637 RepID=A0A8J6Q631_9FLAO|nr:zinc-dependent metalloprotease family protein [Aestuariibaculum sediminum]MBD0831438.1 proprotein convertase P-domain-containing protein [Aestuariibaculum sediminum]
MNKNYVSLTFCILSFFLFSLPTYSQNKPTTWTKVSKDKALNGKIATGKHKLNKASYYQLNLTDIKPILEKAATAKSINASEAILSLPDSDGEWQSYKIIEASIMAPGLQAKYPNIKTYEGESTVNAATKIRLSLTPSGLHSMVLHHNKSTQFIDPVSFGNNNYIVYKKSDLQHIEDDFLCHFIKDPYSSKDILGKSASTLNANDGILRNYDLALAATVEYSTYHINLAGLNGGSDAQKKAAVLAAMNVTMNRVNGIFKRDLSLTMTIINNTDDIIFLNEPDGYTNDDGSILINENQTVIDNIIGTANYDIGHVFSTGGGGIAALNSPCIPNQKAKGVTGLSNPIGDVFDVEFVAHEMGHQFGAPHTWSALAGGCTSGEWSNTNAYEPGSGSSIMSYAGLCAPENVQANGDDYFHQKSLQMIWANITGGNSSTCDTETNTGNSAPTANAGNNYTIPISTPYKLTGSSSDADGTGSHTFNWEQYDLAQSQGSISETNQTGPLVRSVPPTSNPTRYIPNLNDLANSGGSTTWEKLAAVSRTLNFQFTVRDNDNRGGQTATDNMTVTVNNSGGPFEVTSQNDATLSYPSESTQTITWNVSGTNAAPFNTSKVNIKLSTDGGLTYDTTLLASTDNDGSANVTFPSGVSAPYCRIMIEADPSENIFFAISKENFALGYTISTNCNTYAGGSNLPLNIIDNNNGYQTSVINVTESTAISDINVSVNIDHTYKGDLQIALLSPEGTELRLLSPNLCGADNLIVTYDDDGNTLDCNNTSNNEMYKPVEALNNLNGQDPSGTWTLGVVDLADDDTGTLNSWSIELCTTTITLSDKAFTAFKNTVSVYPNPSKGEFTVKFNNRLGNTVHLGVYDIRGRLIYSEAYSRAGELHEVISLSQAQSGIYILKLDDGFHQTSKKIIIE